MELQTFINNNTDYLSKFRDLKLNTKKYGELGLAIVTYKYNFNYDLNEYPFIKWCKGAIINLKTSKIVCLSPVKSENKYDLSNIDLNNIDEYYSEKDSVLQPLIDGTMINLFYHNDEWLMSTRSYIGAKNKWDQNISFKKMFDESKKNLNYDSLNKKHSYSFVLQHINNRIVSQISENNIILVEEYNFEDSISIVNLDVTFDLKNYDTIIKIKNNNFNVLEDSMNKSYNFQFKGFTLKNGPRRINFINSEYQKVLNIKSKCNFNNKLLSFIYLRNNNLLKDYLKYFDDDLQLFDNYRNKIYIMKNELHDCYIKFFIKKEIEKKDIPFQLKPLVFELHNIYKQNKTKITNNVVNQYIYNLPEKRLCFVINYYITS